MLCPGPPAATLGHRQMVLMSSGFSTKDKQLVREVGSVGGVVSVQPAAGVPSGVMRVKPELIRGVSLRCGGFARCSRLWHISGFARKT